MDKLCVEITIIIVNELEVTVFEEQIHFKWEYKWIKSSYRASVHPWPWLDKEVTPPFAYSAYLQIWSIVIDLIDSDNFFRWRKYLPRSRSVDASHRHQNYKYSKSERRNQYRTRRAYTYQMHLTEST